MIKSLIFIKKQCDIVVSPINQHLYKLFNSHAFITILQSNKGLKGKTHTVKLSTHLATQRVAWHREKIPSSSPRAARTSDNSSGSAGRHEELFLWRGCTVLYLVQS